MNGRSILIPGSIYSPSYPGVTHGSYWGYLSIAACFCLSGRLIRVLKARLRLLCSTTPPSCCPSVSSRPVLVRVTISPQYSVNCLQYDTRGTWYCCRWETVSLVNDQIHTTWKPLLPWCTKVFSVITIYSKYHAIHLVLLIKTLGTYYCRYQLSLPEGVRRSIPGI